MQNRQRFAHALAEQDAQVIFEGGWLMPMGQEDALREFLHVYRQLPQASFEYERRGTQEMAALASTNAVDDRRDLSLCRQ